MPKRKAAATVSVQAADIAVPSTSGKDDALSSVLYIGHVPHGFYEKQMKEYFTQFGRVSKVRMSRNKKSGASKHYAFIEFSTAGVARIAAEAMDGYMFFGQKLVAHVMKDSEVHADLFKGANRVFKKVPWRKIETERHNKELTAQEERHRTRAAVKRDIARQQKIKEAGIDYEYEGLEQKLPTKAKKTKFADDS